MSRIHNTKDQKKLNKKSLSPLKAAGAVIFGIVFTLAALLIYLCMWFMKVYGFSFSQLVYTMTSPLKGTGSSVVAFIVKSCLPVLILIIIVYVIFAYFFCQEKVAVYLCVRFKRKSRHIDVLKLCRRIGAVFCVIFLAASLHYVDNVMGVSEYISAINDETTIYEDYYVDPDTTEITENGSLKNIIYIYLESMETTYASVEAGGIQDVNYIPLLTELAADNLSFSDDSNLGGFVSLTGTDNTMGALVATSTGLPLAFPVEENNMNLYENFAPGMSTLGDILKEYGYNQEFLCGSDADFAGRKSFFEQHGDYKVYDYYSAIDDGYIDEDYYVWWGLEDAILYEIAKDELTEMAAESERFNFTMLTVDTHHFDGYICELCGDEYDTQLANVLQCADNQVAEFVAWCMEQDFYEDTVIIITGDHPRMDTSLVDGVDYEDRTVYNCIINSDTAAEGETTNRAFTSMDMFPTILAAMGFEIEGDRLGLGTNLYSGEKTLLEMLGYDYLQGELAKYSQFYINKFGG